MIIRTIGTEMTLHLVSFIRESALFCLMAVVLNHAFFSSLFQVIYSVLANT